MLAGNTAETHGGAVSICAAGSPSIENCTLAGNAAPVAGGLYCENMVVVEKTIIAFSQAGEAVYGLIVPDLSCCDLYGNAGGDWTGGIEHLQGQLGNISADPMFCDLPGGNYAIEHDSPCCPALNECGLVGAGPIGCAAAEAMEPESVAGPSFLACSPNPFRDRTRIRAASPGRALLTIHDPRGRRIRTLLDARDFRGAGGVREIVWDGRDDQGRRVASGLYFCRLSPVSARDAAGPARSTAGVRTERVILIR